MNFFGLKNISRFLKLFTFIIIFLFLHFSSSAFALEEKQGFIRIAISNIYFSEKIQEKTKIKEELYSLLNSVLNDNSEFKVFKSEENTAFDILTSDDVLKIGKFNSVDIVLTGSVIKLSSDFILNIRLMEVVSGRVIFSKEYLVKQNEISKIKNSLSVDLSFFAENIENSGIYFFDSGSGSSEIRINSLPSGSKVAFDGSEVGITPLIIKNVSDTQHLIETWQEEKPVIRNLNISASDENIFQFKFENKIYTETAVKLFDLKKYNYEFEIIANPEEKERPKFSDIKFDSRRFKLEIVTDSENSQVFVDGRPAGASPLTLDNIQQGKHTISLSRKKIFVFREIVDSYNNKISSVNFNFFRLGRALISSSPQGADIFIEGEKIGITPKSIDLPLGRHNIEIKKDGYNSEEYSLNISEEKTNELNLNLTSLRNFDNTVAYIPTASVDNTLGVSVFSMTLGQYYSDNQSAKGIAYIYGTEVNYGIKNIFSFEEYINFGTQFGIYYNKMSTFTLNKSFPGNQGLGLKVQFINQGDKIPVSAAIGTFYNINSNLEQKINFYAAASRDFGAFSAHLGVIAQPVKLSAISLSINYNRFYRIKIGVSVLIDFNLLATGKDEHITPLLGLTFGYNFL